MARLDRPGSSRRCRLCRIRRRSSSGESFQIIISTSPPLPLELLWKPLRTAAVGTLCPMIEWFPVSMLSIIKWSERLFRGLCTRPVKQRCRTVSLSLIMARLNNILRHDSQRLSLFVMICKLISNWLQQSIVFHELVWLSFSWPIGGRGNPPQTHTGNSHLFIYFSFFM